MTPGSVSSPLSQSVSKLMFTRVFLASYHPCILSLHAIPFSLSLHHNRGHPMAPYETCGILCLKVSQTYLPSLCLFPPSICLCLRGCMCTCAQLVGVSSFLSSWVLGTELRSPAQEQVFFSPHFAILSASSPLLCSVLCWAGSVYRVSDSNCSRHSCLSKGEEEHSILYLPPDPCFIPSSLIHTVCGAQFEVWVVRRVKFSILTSEESRSSTH